MDKLTERNAFIHLGASNVLLLLKGGSILQYVVSMMLSASPHVLPRIGMLSAPMSFQGLGCCQPLSVLHRLIGSVLHK